VSLDIKIKELMDREPLVISIDTDLANIINTMADSDKKVAIVMDGIKIKGIIKFSDLCYAIKVYILEKLVSDDIPFKERKTRVEQMMKSPTLREICEKCGFDRQGPPISVEEEHTVADAIKVMASSGLDTLLVRRGKKDPSILTDEDVIKVFKK
jgi:predicted transcriptional regulator